MGFLDTEFNGYLLHCRVFGHGPHALLAFHGFGQQGDIYRVFEEDLKEKYTVYSFDQFHHGLSRYPPNKRKSAPFSPQNWRGLLQKFLETNGISTFSVMGYSLGGKTALATVEMFPDCIERIYLLAPDGVVESGWYRFVSRNRAGELMYKSMIRKPDFLFSLMKGMSRVGMVSEKEVKFATENLNTVQKRKLVYYTWRSYALLRPHLRTVKEIINARKIQAFIITGRYDTVLNPRIGDLFVANLHAGCRHISIPAGHDLIRQKTRDVMKPLW
jgi:pimeloyl-ACP methyl ester carboxylesterase